jgi:hypothetical protein
MEIKTNMDTIQDIKDCEEGGSLYIYRTLEGVLGSSEDPVIGNRASLSVLRQETDFTPQRKHPSIGDRIECYQVKGNNVIAFDSDWVVYHVELFPGTGLIKEVVIAWCRKEYLFQGDQTDFGGGD